MEGGARESARLLVRRGSSCNKQSRRMRCICRVVLQIGASIERYAGLRTKDAITTTCWNADAWVHVMQSLS